MVTRPTKKITDDDISLLLQSGYENSLTHTVGAGSSVVDERKSAIKYYDNRARGDEIPGSSSVQSSDVFDSVEGLHPDIMEIFTSSDDIVNYVGQNGDSTQTSKDVSDYVNYIFLKQNPGYKLLYNATHDALLLKTGYLKYYWDESEEESREKYEGITEEERALLLSDEDSEVSIIEEEEFVEVESVIDPMTGQAAFDPQTGAPVINETKTYNMHIKRVNEVGKLVIECPPPEDISVSPGNDDIKECDVYHRTRKEVWELVAQGYDYDEILQHSESTVFGNIPTETRERLDDESDQVDVSSVDPSRRTVTVTEAIRRIDVDGDGIAELWKILAIGEHMHVIDKEEVDFVNYVRLAPYEIPHKFYGLSIADLSIDIQDSKTAVMRQMMDNFYRTNNSQKVVNPKFVDNLQALVDGTPGAIILSEDPNAITPIPVQAMSPESMGMLDYWDRVREQRTGIYRNGQGLQADALNKTAAEVFRQTNNEIKRPKFIAKNMAEQLRPMFYDILQILSRYNEQPIEMRIAGRDITIDPHAWHDKYDIEVQVGLGTGNKDQTLQQLFALYNVQKELVQFGIASPMNIYSVVSRIAELANLGNVNNFFTDPSTLPPPEPQPEPVDPILAQMQVAQQQLEIELAKVQSKAELESQKLALDAQKQALEEEKAAMDAEIKHRQLDIKQDADDDVNRRFVAELVSEKNERLKGELLEAVNQVRASNGDNPVELNGNGGVREVVQRADPNTLANQEAMMQLMQALASPKEVVRDENGNIIGSRNTPIN